MSGGVFRSSDVGDEVSVVSTEEEGFIAADEVRHTG